MRDSNVGWPVEQSYIVLGGRVFVSLAILYRQVGRMEREA